MKLTRFTAYVGVSTPTIIINGISAVNDFYPTKQLLAIGAELGVPASWLPMLGSLKAAGALGLLIGIGVPLVDIDVPLVDIDAAQIATAAAIGLVMFYVGASIVHLRAGDYALGPQHVMLLLAVATLVLGLASSPSGRSARTTG